jgi:hypothetical protein
MLELAWDNRVLMPYSPRPERHIEAESYRVAKGAHAGVPLGMSVSLKRSSSDGYRFQTRMTKGTAADMSALIPGPHVGERKWMTVINEVKSQR